MVRALYGFVWTSAVTIAMANTASADLITNGSFENAAGGLPDDWNPTGNLRVVQNQGETDGQSAVAFSWGNVPSDGSISQTFSTTPGIDYALRFDFGKYSVNQPLESARLQVEIFDGAGFLGAGLLDELIVDSTPAGGEPNSSDSPNVYSPYGFQFTGLSAMSTIRFSDLSDPQSAGGGFDAMLDNVRINAVPEPSGLVLLGYAGLCCLTSGRRRR